MTWKKFEHGSLRGISGDLACDEMAGAVKRIGREYLERFGRRPYFAELFYALYRVITATPTATITDQWIPTLDELATSLGKLDEFQDIDPLDYVGGWDSQNDAFVISRRSIEGNRVQDDPVIRGHVTKLAEQQILCRYWIADHSILPRMAEALIRQCVLQDLLRFNIVEGSLVIRFETIEEGIDGGIGG